LHLFNVLAETLDGAFAVDRRQRIILWNDAARDILGFESGTVLGRPCHEILGGRDESGCAVCRKGCTISRASLRRKLSPTTDIRVRASRGRWKWINVTTFLVPSRHRESSLLAHVFRDASQSGGGASRLHGAPAGVVTRRELERLPPPLAPLTGTESEVLRLLACGASTDRICSRLHVRRTTVRTHVQHIMEKLGVHTRLEAVASGAWNGLLRPPTD